MAGDNCTPRRYVIAMGLWVLLLSSSIPAMNIAMDPLGYARVVGWRAASPTPQQLRFAAVGAWPVPHGTREAKILNVAYYAPDSVIFGSSTVWSYVDAGYAPLRKADGRSAFNFGLPGISAREMLAAFEHLVALHPPKLAIVGLEFYMFSADKATSPGFFDLPLAQRPSFRFDQWRFVARRLLSADYTQESAVMLFKPLGQWLGSWLGRPVYAAGQPEAAAEHTPRSDFLKLMSDTDRIMVTALYPAPGRPFRFVDDEGWSSMDAIRRMVAVARAHGIDLRFYISPNHARTFETIRLMGWWPEYEAWERELTEILAEDARTHAGQSPIPLWDFCCYNSVTADPLLSAPTATNGFRYFADSVHFKTEVGYMFMDRILGVDTRGQVPDDFGVMLTAANIDAHLSSINRGHEAYIAAHGEEVREIAAGLQSSGRLRPPAR
jgi:hypothetical protein